jgi:hypothetical protein
MQGGYESGTEGLGELRREEWLVIEEDGSQVIQCQI